MPAEVHGQHLLAEGIRLHYLEHAGEGPPLIVIPGITSTAVTWEFISARLAEFARVYTLDTRGRGLFSGGPDLDYWLADYAGDTANFIAALGLDAPIVLGHSMGARIAIKLAAVAPDCVGRMILVDPPVSGPGRRKYPIPLQWYFVSTRPRAATPSIRPIRCCVTGPKTNSRYATSGYRPATARRSSTRTARSRKRTSTSCYPTSGAKLS